MATYSTAHGTNVDYFYWCQSLHELGLPPGECERITLEDQLAESTPDWVYVDGYSDPELTTPKAYADTVIAASAAQWLAEN